MTFQPIDWAFVEPPRQASQQNRDDNWGTDANKCIRRINTRKRCSPPDPFHHARRDVVKEVQPVADLSEVDDRAYRQQRPESTLKACGGAIDQPHEPQRPYRREKRSSQDSAGCDMENGERGQDEGHWTEPTSDGRQPRPRSRVRLRQGS